LEWQQDMSDNHEFMSLLKSDLDLFSDSVFCFTPNGDVKSLPKGSTPIDFAYSIHTAVGNKMIGAKVNGKLVTIDYEIRNGDRIEILTSQNSRGPSRDWLNIVKSTQAKNKINQWFRNEFKEENIIRGKELLNIYCKGKGYSTAILNKNAYQEKVQKKYGFKDWNSVLAAVGHGGLTEAQIVNRLMEEERKVARDRVQTDDSVLEAHSGDSKEAARVTERDKQNQKRNQSGIIIKGLSDVAVHFSKCCSPVPGDEIVGFVTRGRGVSIHRTDCINIIKMPSWDRDRLIEAEWARGSEEEQNSEGRYLVEITVYGHNRMGLLVDISKIFTEREIDIATISSRTSKKGVATIDISFRTKGKDELSALIEKIRQVDSVFDIKRSTGG
ncbi:MAG TPA: GTP pyrophosphokinase, partial [Lachnospiraceae bacterium]|nr:GTP pyrophosphokinase [Lachnospiraceae bacterium]